MNFIKNEKTNKYIKMPSNKYYRLYECMKHTKIGTLVNFDEGGGVYNQGVACMITLRGLNVATTTKTIFVKWCNILGVYVK